MLPPTRDRILAAPPRCSPNTRPNKDVVYPENNREMMPKLYLGPECSMETNSSTHPQVVHKSVDNSKQIRL